MQTFDINGVEIFECGTHRGVEYKDEDLQLMADNYDMLKDKVKPPVKLGHNEDQSILQADGLPSAGWVTNLKKVGSKLIADFKSVPRAVKDIIDAGGYNRVSSEIYNTFKDSDGSSYSNVLRAVALLGADVPQVKTLKDLVAMYGENDTSENISVFTYERSEVMEEKKEEVVVLSEVAPEEKVEAPAIVEDKPEAPIVEEKKEEPVLALSEKDSDSEKLLNEKEAEIKKLKEEIKRRDVVSKVDKKIAEGKLIPAQREFAVALFMELEDSRVLKFSDNGESKELKLIDVLSSFIEANPKHNLFSVHSESKVDEKSETEKDVEFRNEVDKYAEENKLPWTDAYRRVSEMKKKKEMKHDC